MLYEKILKKMRAKNLCPFCKINKSFIIKENRYAYITLARAPYVKNHLLVIPKKHVTKLHNLSAKQKSALFELIIWGLDNMHKKYSGVEVEYKEGDLLSARKSIDHSHVHLIPRRTKHKKSNPDKRKFLSEKEILQGIKKLKSEF